MKWKGFAPIWIVLIILLLTIGGIFALKRGYIKSSNQNSKTSPTTQPATKKVSLREVCLDKIKDIPAPPFSYKSKNTMGTLLPLHKQKERFPNEEKASACITDYSVLAVKEQAFKDMGFDYYVFDKLTGNKLLNYPALNGQFNKAVDKAYTELMSVKNWKKVTPEGQREGGLPYIVYYKEDGGYKMYADISQGTDMYFFVTLTVIGQ